MKLYRGVSKKKCNEYLKKGIPKGTNFTKTIKDARRFGSCIIEVNKNKNFKAKISENRLFRKFKIPQRDYINKKPVRRFKIK